MLVCSVLANVIGERAEESGFAYGLATPLCMYHMWPYSRSRHQEVSMS